MKLERIPEYLMVTVVTLLGMGFALYAGKYAGAGQIKMVVMMLGMVSAGLVVLLMRANIWLLIPLSWPLMGQLQMPGHLPLRDVVIAMVFVVFLALKALKVVRVRPTYSGTDVLMFVNLLYLLSVFIRNPVGVEAFGSDKVGGRPYVEVIFALLAYWVLIRVRVGEQTSRSLPFVMIVGDLVGGVIGFITFHFPSTVPLIARFYTGIDATTFTSELNQRPADPEDSVIREQYLVAPASSVFRLQCAKYTPASLLKPIYFWRFLFCVLAVLAILKSGHRITIPHFAAMFLMGSYFRRGISEVIKFAAIGVPLIVLVIALQTTQLIELPLSAQRALSFLPGKWDYKAVEAAQVSSEWRYVIWRQVWNSDRYISNKWLGDGFGFTRQQLREMVNSQDAQENFMISGDYHSGPLSTIRNVGCVGLALLYLLQISMILKAWRLVSTVKNTPFFSLGLFVAMPAIYVPFSYTFLSGGFNSALPDALYALAWLKIVEESCVLWRKTNLPSKEAQAGHKTTGFQQLDMPRGLGQAPS